MGSDSDSLGLEIKVQLVKGNNVQWVKIQAH